MPSYSFVELSVDSGKFSLTLGHRALQVYRPSPWHRPSSQVPSAQQKIKLQMSMSTCSYFIQFRPGSCRCCGSEKPGMTSQDSLESDQCPAFSSCTSRSEALRAGGEPVICRGTLSESKMTFLLFFVCAGSSTSADDVHAASLE